ncbi:hemerythrin family protein [Magnetovibrio sp. PR-2]|uniref:bacteriohemerythrin n=1 Tax=Magnetovibrio sp. PR-2 TaxID=3120356 RepID=UPI002FCE1E2E
MSHVQWSSTLEIDHSEIDAQHKQLVVLADLLLEAVEHDPDDTVVRGAFDALLLYTKKHFEDEEAYFKKHNSTQLEEHVKEHEILAEEIKALWQDDMMGFRDEVLQAILGWVESRLIPHMTGSDQDAYKACQD